MTGRAGAHAHLCKHCEAHRSSGCHQGRHKLAIRSRLDELFGGEVFEVQSIKDMGISSINSL